MLKNMPPELVLAMVFEGLQNLILRGYQTGSQSDPLNPSPSIKSQTAGPRGLAAGLHAFWGWASWFRAWPWWRARRSAPCNSSELCWASGLMSISFARQLWTPAFQSQNCEAQQQKNILVARLHVCKTRFHGSKTGLWALRIGPCIFPENLRILAVPYKFVTRLQCFDTGLQ